MTGLNPKASCPTCGYTAENCSNIFRMKALIEKEYKYLQMAGAGVKTCFIFLYSSCHKKNKAAVCSTADSTMTAATDEGLWCHNEVNK